jgi:hypothetical protein
MPIEHEVLSGWLSISIGRAIAAIIFSATCCAPSSSVVAQVLEDHRELVAAQARHRVGRAHARVSRAATAFSSSSPTWWPSESLMVLKRSRSMNMKREAGVVARRVDDALLEAVVQQHAVGQPGERVARGQVLGALLGALRLVTLVEVPVIRSACPPRRAA